MLTNVGFSKNTTGFASLFLFSAFCQEFTLHTLIHTGAGEHPAPEGDGED
jgi:hypothetical protein